MVNVATQQFKGTQSRACSVDARLDRGAMASTNSRDSIPRSNLAPLTQAISVILESQADEDRFNQS
jgi:hypothetical protein